MSKNQFVVDLGDLTLTETQRTKMNAAIQRAVAGELAELNFKDQVALFPVEGKRPLGPILEGLIARRIDVQKFKDVLKFNG
jgi:hypothetical protein